jgi:hypothetical protein
MNLYRVYIDGCAVPVRTARVSAVPLNQVWPGYQRPLDQTELAAFAYWSMDREVTVEIESARPVESVTVRPRALGLSPEVNGHHIGFKLPVPAYFTVEVNGTHHALHCFSDPPECEVRDPDDSGVIYFGPGEHDAGRIRPQSGQTVYIAEGAVVYGTIEARGESDITVRGRGILDGSRVARTHRWYWNLDDTDDEPYGTLACYECKNIDIDGIIIRDPNIYNVALFACRGIKVSNVKIVGSWRYNSDGIDLINSSDAVIEHCFVRSFDDSIVVTGLPRHRGCHCGHLPADNIQVRDCVIWNDWGRGLEIGAACSAPRIGNVHFTNCDIIHVSRVALDVQNVGRAWVENVAFENIRVELDGCAPGPRLQQSCDEVYTPDPADDYCPALCVVEVKKNRYSRDAEHGHVQNVLFKDITATGRADPPSYVRGFDAAHRVENVTFENLVIDGRTAVDMKSAHVAANPHAAGITIRADPATRSRD